MQCQSRIVFGSFLHREIEFGPEAQAISKRDPLEGASFRKQSVSDIALS